MSEAELKNIKKKGDFSEQILENLVKMVLPVDPDFEKATLLL